MFEPQSRPAASARVDAAPIVTFNTLVPGCRPPRRADRSAAGTLPTRAFRYCEAVTGATAFGWYLFPPIGLTFWWDGGQIYWTYDGAESESWMPLTVAQFPGFADHFDKVAPEAVKGFSPPFVAALKEPGVIQIWSGLIARTAPGWSLLVRPLPNLPRAPGFELYEGIVETDRWFGPLFTNLRLTKTDVPVRLEPDFPFAQAVAVPRMAYSDEVQNNVRVVDEIAALTAEDWADYAETVVKPNTVAARQRGQYAVDARKRRKSGECPYAGLSTAAGG